ncbi:hypothetical protein Tco_1181713 [Tanacetum coccineum]
MGTPSALISLAFSNLVLGFVRFASFLSIFDISVTCTVKGPIIQKSKVVGELMTSLGKRYDRLKVIPDELGISPSLPALDKFFPSPQEGKGNIGNWNLKPISLDLNAT